MSRTKEQDRTDFEIVEQQFLKIPILENRINNINTVSKYHKGENEIGNLADRVKYHTYMEVFNSMYRNEAYTISLVDGSMINMHYIFDENKNMKKHTLSFMPNYRVDLLVKQEQEEQELDANVSDEKLSLRLNNYIRIDYDEVGREDYYHSLVHLHIGVSDQAIRIPMQYYMFPNDFLFFIFKYVYRHDDNTLNSLMPESKMKCMLEENERKRLKLVYGE